MDNKKQRTKVDRVCCGITNATEIAAATTAIVFHIKEVVKEKHYGLLDGFIDCFCVGFICDGIRGMAKAIGNDSQTTN